VDVWYCFGVVVQLAVRCGGFGVVVLDVDVFEFVCCLCGVDVV